MMTHKHAQAPAAPWTRGRQMLELRQAQTIPTIGPEEGPGVDDPSILQSVMPHQVADGEAGAHAGAGAGAGNGADANENPGASAGGARNAPKRHMLTHSPAGCTLTGPMYLTWKQLRLGQVEYQAWFCQQLGLEPPCLAPPINIAPVAEPRFTPITCTPAGSIAATGMRHTSAS